MLVIDGRDVNLTSCPRHRWKGGESMKLEGSDHAPVFVSLREIPDVSQHNTPSLSARYDPRVRGCQQTIGTKKFDIFFDD